MLNLTCQNIDLKCFKAWRMHLEAFKPDCCNTSLQQNTAAWLTKGCDQALLVIFIFSFFTFLSTLLVFKGAILIHLTRLDSEGSGGKLLKGSMHFNELVTSVPVYGSSSYIKLFTPTEQWRKYVQLESFYLNTREPQEQNMLLLFKYGKLSKE